MEFCGTLALGGGSQAYVFGAIEVHTEYRADYRAVPMVEWKENQDTNSMEAELSQLEGSLSFH